MSSLDPRLVRVGIEVNGQLKTYDGLAIYATGTKFANAIQNEAEIRIANLDKATRDYILTETSPLNPTRVPKRVILEAGRVSYGLSTIIIGDIISSSVSQPPDVWISLKILTGNFQSGNIMSVNQGAVSTVSAIAKQLSQTTGLSIDFQATDKNISNYSFSGPAIKQVDKINDMGDYSAYVDDNTLVVKNKREPLQGQSKVLNIDSGMIGIPEISPYGIKVKYLLDNVTRLGGALTVQSRLNPVANGTFCIYKLSFEIANRDTPFYYVAEGYKI